MNLLTNVEESVLARKCDYRNSWQDKDDNFWYRSLVEEFLELSLSLDGQHEDPPEVELEQIATIAMNWLELRAKRATK